MEQTFENFLRSKFGLSENPNSSDWEFTINFENSPEKENLFLGNKFTWIKEFFQVNKVFENGLNELEFVTDHGWMTIIFFTTSVSIHIKMGIRPH